MGKLSYHMEKYKASMLFGQYYCPMKDTIGELLKHYEGKTIAIWGGDHKGRAFLQIADKSEPYIKYVIDINKALWGKRLLGRDIISCFDLKDKGIDIVILLHQRHFVQNYNILKDQGIDCIIHDMDEIVLKKMTLKDILQGMDMVNDTEENEEMTRVIQRELLPLLEEVKRVCDKNKIPYFLCAGSALGAVRHQGFIPWDDDIDIGMIREDYERFIQIADKELESGYLLMDAERTPEYYVCHAKVFRDNTALVNRRTNHLKLHHGFYLDIFPFDVLPDDELQQDELYWTQKVARNKYTKMKKRRDYQGKNPIKRFIANDDYYWRNIIYSSKRVHDNAIKAMTACAHKKDIKYIADLCAPYNKKLFFKYKDIYPTRTLMFEGKEYPVPRNYDEYLKTMYGDYMTLPPKDKRYVKHDIIEMSTEHNWKADEGWLKKFYKKYKQ